MARAPTKKQLEADRGLLESVVIATRSAEGALLVKVADVQRLVDAGLVEVSPAETVNGENYVRATETGMAQFPLTENESANPGAIENQTIESNNSMNDVQTAPTAETAKPKRIHNMVDASTIITGMGLPPSGKRGGGSGRKGVYKFSELAPPMRDAQGNVIAMAFFFVPATAERPEPARSLNATVSGANKKAAEAVDPATGLVKQFKVFADQVDGVDGAKVFRMQ